LSAYGAVLALQMDARNRVGICRSHRRVERK